MNVPLVEEAETGKVVGRRSSEPPDLPPPLNSTLKKKKKNQEKGILPVPCASPAKMRNMVSASSPRGIATIVGVGPKLGRSIARKFAHEGYTVAILARDLGTHPSSIPFFIFFFFLQFQFLLLIPNLV